MSLTREPLNRADGRRAGELLLAYLAHEDDRYAELVDHTLAEYHPAAIIDALVALWAGQINWLEESYQETVCREAMRSYVAEPIDEDDDPIWDLP